MTLGDGFRVETTDLATGRVKAVLQPVSVNWTEALSKNSEGSIVLATGDVTVADVWPDLSGIYISRVVNDQRQCLFAGYIDQYAIPISPQTVSVGFVSMDTYLNQRAMANQDGGIAYSVSDREQTQICKDFVDMASWDGIPLLAIAEDSDHERAISYGAHEVKNLGEAVQQMTTLINGPEYKLESQYIEPGHWFTTMRFQDHVGEDRNVILKSDVDGLNCGITSDAKNHATRCYAIGAGEEAQQLMSIAHDAASIYPEFHATPAWKDLADPGTLEAQAVGHVATYRDPITIPTMSIAGLSPDPDLLQVGDTVSAEIIAKSFRFDGKARVIAIGWNVDTSGVRRVPSLQPVIRPALSILVKSIIPVTPPDPNAPTGGDEPVGGYVTNIRDARITESSGLAYAHNIANRVYTHNDEGENPQIFAIDLKTGNTVGEWGLSVPTLDDPESIRLDPRNGELWIADIGDNDKDRTTKYLVKTSIPASGTSTRYPVTYPGGIKLNAEALLIHPTTGKKYIATKEDGTGRLFEYPATLSTSSNVGVQKYATLPAGIADGTFSPDGRFMLFRTAGSTETLVWDFASGKRVDGIASPALPKGESITMEPNGKSFLIGTEGPNSPIFRVVLPEKYRASTSAGGSPSPNGLPSGLIDLTNWKLNLPTCPYREVKQPALATFEQAPWFWDDGPVVVFRANAGGCTTSGSSYPRSELREMKNGGGTNASWSNSSGTHTMTIRQSINYTLKAKKHVVAGQIHDADDDVTVLRLEGNQLWMTNGNNTHHKLLDGNYVLGTEFTVKFTANSSGITIDYNNGAASGFLGKRISGAYFKAGAYTQSNTSKGDSSSAYGEVRIRSLVVTHG